MRKSILVAVLSTLVPLTAQTSRPTSTAAIEPADVSGRTLAMLRGRCVADEDGTPLPGCVVKLHGYVRNHAELARGIAMDWRDPAPVATDAEGRFALSFALPPAFQLNLAIQAPGRAPHTGHWPEFAAGKVEDLGDVRCARGHRVRGRVVDAGGKPVAKATVVLKGLPFSLPAAPEADDRHYCRSDAVGEFEVAVLLPNGRWPLEVSCGGMRLKSPRELAVDGSGEPVVLHLEQLPGLSGVVVDEDGQPAAGIALGVEPQGTGLEPATTDAAGRFLLLPQLAQGGKVRIVPLGEGAFEPFEPTPQYEWGADAIRITVRRTLSFELQVVDQDTGQPVEEYAVRCHATRASRLLQMETRLGGRHPGGKVVVDRVWHGTNRLVVVPTDPLRAASEEVLVEANAPPLAPVKVAVLRRRPGGLMVRVVDRDGQPTEGSAVELVDPMGHPFHALSFAVDPSKARVHVAAGKMPWPLIVATETTDRLGRAWLRLPPAQENLLAVRVRGKAHAVFVVKDIQADEGQPMLELVAPRAARVQGKVLPAELGKVVPGLRAVLRAPGDPMSGGFGDDLARMVAADGSFTFDQLPAQEIEILLVLAERPAAVRLLELTRPRPWAGEVLDGAGLKLTLKEGETATAVLEAPELRPGRIRARVVGEAGPAQGVVILMLASPAIRSEVVIGEFRLDSDGWFEVPAALPGRYRAALQLPGGVLPFGGEWTLEAGKPAEWTFRK